MTDIWIAIALTYATLILLAVSILLFRSATAPFGLYGGLWCFSLALLHLRLVVLEPLSGATFAIYGAAMVLFLAGCITGRMFGVPPPQPEKSMIVWREEKRVLYLATLVTFSLSAIGGVLYYRLVNSLLGISIIWKNPSLLRWHEVYGDLRHVGAIGFLRGFAVPVTVLALMYVNITGARHKKFIALVGFVSFLSVLPSTGRTVVFTAGIWAVLAVVYTRICLVGHFKFGFRTAGAVVLVTVLAFTYFIVTSTILLKSVDASFPYPHKLPSRLIVLADPYLYAVAPLVAFQEMRDSPWLFDHSGSLTFAAVTRVLHELIPSIPYPEFIQPVVYVPVPVNVYTYLDSLFLDFGIKGVVTLPFVYGFLCTAAYLLMIRKPTAFTIYLASLLGLCILSTTIVNRFGMIETWVRVIAIWAVLAFCRSWLRFRQLRRPAVTPHRTARSTS